MYWPKGFCTGGIFNAVCVTWLQHLWKIHRLSYIISLGKRGLLPFLVPLCCLIFFFESSLDLCSRYPQIQMSTSGSPCPPQTTANQLLLWGLFYLRRYEPNVSWEKLYPFAFSDVSVCELRSLYFCQGPMTCLKHFSLSCRFFQPSFTETFFSPELLLPQNDQLKGISQHIHLSSAVLSSSAKNDKPIDFKFLLIRMNPLSWNLKWNSSGPWKRTWQLQSCDYSLIFSPLNPLSWLKSLILKS